MLSPPKSAPATAPVVSFVAAERNDRWIVSPCASLKWLLQLLVAMPMPNRQSAIREAMRLAREAHTLMHADAFAGIIEDGQKRCIWRSWPQKRSSSADFSTYSLGRIATKLTPD